MDLTTWKNAQNSIEEGCGSWTACVNCVYFEDCTNKEDRDGCYHGEEEVL